MAESILKIHTQNGNIPVGYPDLANKPIADKTLSEEGAFARLQSRRRQIQRSKCRN